MERVTEQMTSGSVPFPTEAGLPQVGRSSTPSLDHGAQAAGSAAGFPRGCLWEERGVLCVVVTGLRFKPQDAGHTPLRQKLSSLWSTLLREPGAALTHGEDAWRVLGPEPGTPVTAAAVDASLCFPCQGLVPFQIPLGIWGCLPLLNPTLLPDDCLKTL